MNRVTLGILYHMPFWQAADGSLWEAEGSFARYVDSLAPYFDEILLSVPVFDAPQASGSRVRASNVRLAPLPYFPGPRQFYPMLPRIHGRLKEWVKQCDVVHLRIPTPAAIFVFRIARALRKPVFLLVVGDYQALLPHLPYQGVKKTLFGAYVRFEEWAVRHMTARTLTFVNGASLRTGDLSVVSTDHCPFCFKEQKELGVGNFSKIPNGIGSVEHRMDLLYQGVVDGRISLPRWVELCCTTPARMFGLHPRKGEIVPGADGDVVVYDPNTRTRISVETHHMNMDHSAWEGYEIAGGVDTVLSRGTVVVQRGEYLGTKGHGKFLRRGLSSYLT